MTEQNLIEHIKNGDVTLAIIIRRKFQKEGIEFFTPDEFSQQLAYMKRPEGYEILPHLHKKVERSISLTKEVIFLKSGKVRVDFYSSNKIYLKSKILVCGDVILLASGGHGFKMLEESEMIEVKQGPYAGEEDKERFNAVSPSEIDLDLDLTS